MFAFAQNRRNNALQLHNSVRFLASGVSERVNEYLNYIGLTSSRSTALAAMKILSKDHEKFIKEAMALNPSLPVAPTIFIEIWK